ncbi:MAG: thiazole biosynthesis adenylyltransferase ThiF [Phycisphaerae bacterium]|nr:thiazole biosynthesis adenylyltransferase ThiF [Phycisphaerae bacterium]
MDDGRHVRQRLVAGFGGGAQDCLRASSVLIAGCGALGCLIADQVVRAGVGRVVIVDRDIVEPSNLQRQSLFATADLGVPKALAARARLEAVDPTVRIEAWVDSIDRESIEDYIADMDLVFDGFDAMEPRYLLNDVCVRDRVPWVYCAAIATQARAMLVQPDGPCLRCVWPDPPPSGALGTCDTAGVLGSTVAIAAGASVSLGLPVLAGGKPGAPALISVDTADGSWRSISVSRDPACPCCGHRRFDWLEGAWGAGTAVLCGRNAVQIRPAVESLLDEAGWLQRLAQAGSFAAGQGLVRGSLDPSLTSGLPLELTVFVDGRAVVHGTSDPAVAATVCARVLGG